MGGRFMDLEDQLSLVSLGLKKKADKEELEESVTEFAEKLKDATNSVKDELKAKIMSSEGSTKTALEELRQKKADNSINIDDRIRDNHEICKLKDGLAMTTKM